jgi:HSP20 family protein
MNMVSSLVPLRSLFPRSLRQLESEFDRLFEPFFAPEQLWDWQMPSLFAPRTNVAESDNEFEITVDLPGMKPEEFDVELRDGTLWISGERTGSHEEKGKTYLRAERYFGRFQRAIPLTTAVEKDKIAAEYKDGVLRVIVPKLESVKPKHIEVKT